MAVDPAKSAPRTPSRQLMVVGGVLAAAVTLLGIAYYLFLRTDYVVVAQQLKAADASALVAELDKRHLDYRLRDGGRTILVPADQADGTRLAIASADPMVAGQTGFELFNKSDMGLTDFAQKINYQRALQGELARTIMALDGIETARVHLALPERSLFRAERTAPTAAVSLTMKPGQVADASRVAGIQRLVAAAVPDLPGARVVVLDATGRTISADAATAAAPADRSADAEEQNAVQQYYRARARRAFEAQLPSARVAVRVLTLPLDSGAEGGAWVPTGEGAARNFRLRLILVTTAGLGADDQERVRTAVTEAVGLDAGRGDTIAFETGPIDSQPLIAQPPYPVTSIVPAGVAPPEAKADTPGFGLGWMVAAGLGLVLVLFGAVRLLRPAAMSPDEQEAFAQRLRRQLNLSGDTDAAA